MVICSASTPERPRNLNWRRRNSVKWMQPFLSFLWGLFWWVWSAMDGWMDGWHLSSLALTLHTAPEGDTGLIWDPSRNSNRICKFNVQASIEWVNEKNLPRDLHYWSLIFWLFLIKIWSKLRLMVVFSLINLNGVKSDCYLKFWGNMLFILKSSFLV